jgi:F0F1-type ATP synthase membrane subunit c/vacuolar-type H+-ATPase subunit K
MLDSNQLVSVAAYLGAAIGISLSSISAGFGEGFTASYATKAITRQPKASDNVAKSMLISQAVTETCAIFALVVGLLLLFGGATSNPSLARAAALLAAGIATGMGSLGPGMGSGYAGALAVQSLGRMPKKDSDITGNMIVGQALSQASSTFALVVALLLIYAVPDSSQLPLYEQIIRATLYLSASICIGLGTLGPGSAIGYVAGRSNDMLGRYPRQRANITRTMILGSAVTESTAIYSLVIAFLLIFVV